MGVRFVIASFVLALLAAGRGLRVRADATRLTCKVGDVYCGTGCTAVMLCLASNQQYVLSDCSLTNALCDATSMTCKPAADVPTCTSPPDETLFRCHAAGNFPDPYNCHSYFNCDPTARADATYSATGTLVPCPGTTAYDPLTGDCRLTSYDRVCTEGPIPKCVAAAQYGAQRENPNIYFVCVNDPDSNSLVPWLFRCGNITQVFVDGQCQERDALTSTTTTTGADVTSSSSASTTTAASTTTPATTTTTQTVTATEPTTTSSAPSTTTTTTTSAASTTTTTTTAASTTTPYYCVQPGTTVADPLDCRSYYFCTSNMQQVHYTCRAGYYYDKSTAYCLKGSCSN